MNKIAKLSHRVNFFAMTLLYVLPLLYAYMWFNLNQDVLNSFLPFKAILVNSAADITVRLSDGLYVIDSPMTKVIGFSLSLLPFSITMLALLKIRKLLNHYANGKIFTLENALIYRSFALLLFASLFVDMLYSRLISDALTLSNPKGHHVIITVFFDTPHLKTIFIASLVLLISQVMREGFRMAEEQDGIV